MSLRLSAVQYVSHLVAGLPGFPSSWCHETSTISFLIGKAHLEVQKTKQKRKQPTLQKKFPGSAAAPTRWEAAVPGWCWDEEQASGSGKVWKLVNK